MSMKNLVGKTMTKKYPFMGEQVEVRKLSLAQVEDIQAAAKSHEGNDAASIEMLRKVIGLAVVGAEDLTVDDFKTFPIDELNKLSESVLEFSGLGNAKAAAVQS